MNSLIRQLLIVIILTTAAAIGWKHLSALLARAEAARSELPDLREQLRKIKEDQRRALALQQASQHLASEIRKFDTVNVLSPDLPLASASTLIRSRASDAGVEILSLIESTARPPNAEPGPDGQLLTPYRISLEMRGTEDAALRFLRRIEGSNPLIQFHHFSILNMKPGEAPSIFATIEWPTWTGDDKPALLRRLAESAP